MAGEDNNSSVDLASSLTVAWLSNPNTRANADEATAFLQSIHSTLAGLGSGESAPTEAPRSKKTDQDSGGNNSETYTPAVTVRKSLASRDKIISLIDGKPYSTLKRHLGSHGLTPAQYRERYGLKADYPIVAPAYAEKRRALAKKIGLGARPASRKRGRPKKS